MCMFLLCVCVECRSDVIRFEYFNWFIDVGVPSKGSFKRYFVFGLFKCVGVRDDFVLAICSILKGNRFVSQIDTRRFFKKRAKERERKKWGNVKQN